MLKQAWVWMAVLALGVLAWGQVEPLGIVIEPPTETGLQVKIWTDKPVYAVGESVKISFSLNRAAYVYIWDIQPDGKVTQIFPNQYEHENYFQAGTYTIPSPGRGYSFRVQPPLGTEWLQIMASTVPIPQFGGYSEADPFPLLGTEPQGWQQQVEAQILGLVPEPTQRAFDFTSFEIVAVPAPAFGTLEVRTTPALAKLYINGIFRGYTPRSMNLVPGFHNVLIRKDGYQDYTAQVYIIAGRTRVLDVVLTPTMPVVNQPPVAQFSFTPSSPQTGQPVQFDASASYDPDGTIVSYQWDFQNDGVFDRTGVTATWTYSAPGTYQVRLVVTDNRGATGSVVRPVTVTVANQPPMASFTFTPASPRPGDWIRFDATGSFDPDGTIVSYQWDFQNDGTFDATGSIAFFQYAAPGTYTVRLVVTDNLGATGSTTRTVTVTPVAVNQPPVAQFTYSPSTPLVGTIVTFNGTGSYDPDGTIVAYTWDLDGDGTMDRVGPIVTWTYTTAGTYTATLYVTDNQGATGQASQPVVVSSVGIPGMPPMGNIPGIYVWGTDTWNITVNGSPTWLTPRAYRLELRTDGQFVNVQTEVGPMPLGLVPEPTSEGWRLVLEGTVTSGRITYSFQVSGATSIYMDLRLDMDGDGTPDRSPGFVRLRQLMVNPPTNPFVVGVPEGYTGPFVPSLNFRIGTALSYTEFVRIVFWQTTIGALEGP